MAHEPSASTPGLELWPFRGLRYGPSVDDVGAVTAPPYDVLDTETVPGLLARHPHNIVRLILPRHLSDAPSYDGAAALLAEWQQQGVLVRDEEPALYVYEYRTGERAVRGLVGALALRDFADRVILPHEDVMPGPVEDRRQLIAGTASNLEPILVVYDGGGAASEAVDAVDDQVPLVATTTPDGWSHRLWAISDAESLAAIAADLWPRQALIADGHHRYAAYRSVQLQENGDEWGFGLALLVDQQRYPLQLGPIHRVVDGIDLQTLQSRLAHGPAGSDLPLEVQDFGHEAAAAREHAAQPHGDRASFLCTDGDRWLVLRCPRPPGQIDTHVLHEQLLPTWRVGERQVRYLHSDEHAVQEARLRAGVAVLVQPPSLDEVLAAADAGQILPRKSTSFGPKPRMGMVMRVIETD